MPATTAPFWSYAFRPLFLLNGLFAVVVVALWIMTLHGFAPGGFRAGATWHAHEMLVGFGMAAVAGFALTAVATWTGRAPVSGAALGVLVFAWLAGRAAMLLATVLPRGLVATLDLAFPILLCLLLGREVLGAGNRRNYPIVGMTALLAAIDAAFHAGFELPASYLLTHVLLLLITVIAGRIIPNFSANWLRARGETRLPATRVGLDRVTIALTIAVGLGATFAPTSQVTGILAFITAIAHAARLAGWRGLATTAEPLLFVLHVAYAWLPIGYALTGCAIFGWGIAPTSAMHALSMGAIGSMILAVTTRVSLGHTGRKLHAARLTVAAYCILTIAVAFRVASSFAGDAYLEMVDIAALGWMAAFGLFSWVYWPILTGPSAE